MTDQFLLRDGAVMTASGRMFIRPTAAAILGTIKKYQPRVATPADIAGAIWGPQELWPDKWKDDVVMQVSQLRGALRKSGSALVIGNHYGSGYYLEGELEVVQ